MHLIFNDVSTAWAKCTQVRMELGHLNVIGAGNSNHLREDEDPHARTHYLARFSLPITCSHKQGRFSSSTV